MESKRFEACDRSFLTLRHRADVDAGRHYDRALQGAERQPDLYHVRTPLTRRSFSWLVWILAQEILTQNVISRHSDWVNSNTRHIDNGSVVHASINRCE